MKVLVCIPCLLNGGTEVQTLSLVEALVAAGHQPVVACYFEHDSVMVERYRLAGADVRLMSPDSSRTQGLKATISHLYRGLKTIVRDVKPDVAHVQYMAPGALPILILKALGIRRIIATSHTAGDIYGKNGLRMIRLLTRTCLDAFQCITLRAEQSYFGTSSLFDGKRKKHFTIYNALPSHISLRTTPRQHDSDTITIGVVSRLAEIKGMDLVIPAFNLARAKDPRLRLLIVGDGALRHLMDRQAADSPYASNIRFVGLKPQSELQDWYDKIDILLMPSRSEGFGLTAIEGMARGCVPVVANVGGLPEVVTPECGRLHRPEESGDMAKCILQVTDKILELSCGAIERAHCFSSASYRRQIDTLYSLI